MASLENKGNILGDVRGENDHLMLDAAFYDWQDYKILFEGDDRFLVVGRRGSGKSALTYQLTKEWRDKKYFVVVVDPNEEDVIGLRAAAARYGQTLSRIRAAIKTGWRYALIMEIADKLDCYYKTQKEVTDSLLNKPLRQWKQLKGNVISRIKKKLNEAINNGESQEESISELAVRLDINALTSELDRLLEAAGRKVMVIIDRLDEGYEPDEIGVGIVDGIIYGSDDIRNKTANVRAVLFLRDNIFRAIQSQDQDFTRNIEGSVLRLHWDTQELFYLICRRLRIAFDIKVESDIKVWNSLTSNELHGREGFRNCLRLTLYRPRDVISLLNTAFYNAKKQSRSVLIPSDVEASAKHISEIRLDDLRKEYSSVFPGIVEVVKAVATKGSRITVSDARNAIEELKHSTTNDMTYQHLKILDSSDEVIKSLYGIGFFGVLDESSGNIVFSHDGKKSDRTFGEFLPLLIHPCYWSALGLNNETAEQDVAEQIFDEYEITISSHIKEQRNQMIGQLISEVGQIEIGTEGAAQFEDWCKRAIDLIAARKLNNIQLKPNGNAAARRDLVGTNVATEGFWLRTREDYGSRQVVFEIKNLEKLGVDEYRQCASYLGNEYGKFAFIICRDQQKELSKGGEIEAFREFYGNQHYMIVKITATFLSALLSKLRSPQKFDTLDDSLSKHLDMHIRMYANGQGGISKNKRGVRQATNKT